MANRQPESKEGMTQKLEVGMGATKLGWTDRHPYTVIEIRSPKRIVVQADTSTRLDTNGMSEEQDYSYTPDPTGHTVVLTQRKDGSWRAKGEGTRFAVGARRRYHDYSF